MKVGIIGAGSMGSLFAAYFTHAGIDSVIYERNAAIASSMQSGLIIEGVKGPALKIKISQDPSILENCTHFFFFVKSYNTDTALDDIAYIASQNSVIITLQNGLGNIEKIQRFFPEDRIVYGTISYGASKKDYRTIIPGGKGIIVIGGSDTALVEAVHDLIKQAGFNSAVTDNPHGALWHKAIINAAINPLGAILNMPNGKIIENQYSTTLMKQIVYESVDVANFIGINLRHDDMFQATKDVCRKTSNNICSMLQDIRSNNKTEIDSINGTIIETARKNNRSAPYNESVYLLVKALENGR